MKFLIQYIEKFNIRCNVCNSTDLEVYTTRNNKLVIECNRCDEVEEVENDYE